MQGDVVVGVDGCSLFFFFVFGYRFLSFAAVGVSKADYTATDILDEGAHVSFTAHCQGDRLGRVTLGVPGNYNADNALAAMTILHGALDVPFDQIASALSTYQGLENRFTVRHADGITIVKDYISHPTGMRRVLESARKMPHGKIWCVFKPYRFTLMHYHGPEYAEAFRGADEVVITKM